VLGARVLVRFVAPLAVVTTVALPACGGSGGGDSGNLSKAAFAAEANALCAEREAVRTRLLQQLPPQPSDRGDAGTFQLLASVDRGLIRRVDALVPPEAEQDRVDQILDGWRQRAQLEEKYASALPESLEVFTTSVAQIDATVASIANELGLTKCARGAT
jgi:antitoxin component HigA of HigAB toxin-antitoxin module